MITKKHVFHTHKRLVQIDGVPWTSNSETLFFLGKNYIVPKKGYKVHGQEMAIRMIHDEGAARNPRGTSGRKAATNLDPVKMLSCPSICICDRTECPYTHPWGLRAVTRCKQAHCGGSAYGPGLTPASRSQLTAAGKQQGLGPGRTISNFDRRKQHACRPRARKRRDHSAARGEIRELSSRDHVEAARTRSGNFSIGQKERKHRVDCP